MELLLNLAWLLLVLPACWLWRQSSNARTARSLTSLQCLLALGCAVLLLFPVISASDDLHVMRAEMEESVASKRLVRQSTEKASDWSTRLQPLLDVQASAQWAHVPPIYWLQAPPLPPLALSSAAHSQTGRAPPSLLLG